jgi:acetylornithine deacetylase/succinyl-diaminopimelate desuccinylase-like protein
MPRPLARVAKRAERGAERAADAVAGGVRALVKDPAVQAAARWFSSERRWIDELQLQICRIPAPTFFEQRRAEWASSALAGMGWEARIDRAGNVIAHSPEAPASGRLVALTAHLDTVLAPLSADDIRVDERGRLTGPGVSDNGAGLAALFAIARVFSQFRPFGDSGLGLLLVANVGEEGEGNLNGMRYLCRQSQLAPRIRSYLVLDGPSTEHYTAEALACRRFEIVVAGPGGHSWSDFGTANPIHALSRAIAAFTDTYAPRAAAGHAGRFSFNFGVVDGGTTVNAIPASARAKVDLRAEDPALLEALSAELGAALEEALQTENEHAAGGRVTAKRKEAGNRPGGSLPESSALLSFIRAVDAEVGLHSTPDCASTDANIPLSLGLPALSIGAGGAGGGAHTAAEWYSAEGRETGLRRVLYMLGLMLAEAQSE